MAEQLPLVPIVKSTFRIPSDLYRRLKIAAVQEDRPVADLLMDAVELYLSTKPGGKVPNQAGRILR